MARHTDLTPELIEALGNLVLKGMSVSAITGAVGIDQSTFYTWLKKGEDPNQTNELYIQFAKTVKEARAAVQERWLSRIEDAAVDPKTWTAAAWLLERSFPQEFGRRTSVDVTVKEEVVSEIERLALELGVGDPTNPEVEE